MIIPFDSPRPCTRGRGPSTVVVATSLLAFVAAHLWHGELGTKAVWRNAFRNAGEMEGWYTRAEMKFEQAREEAGMMQTSPLSDGTPAGMEHESVSPAPLQGRWLVLARTAWVTVTFTLVLLTVVGYRDIYGIYFTYSPQVLHELHQIGLSPALYSVLGIGLNAVLFQGVYLLLGLLLFLRRSN